MKGYAVIMKKLAVTKNALSGTVWGVMDKTVAVLFPFIIRTVIISELGAEYTGLSSLFISILQVLSLAELGFSSAVVYSMYQPIAHGDTKQISALLKFFRKVYFLIGIFVLFLGILIMPFLNNLISGSVPADVDIYFLFLIYLINTTISYLLFSYRSSLLSAHQREADISKIRMVSNIVMYLLQIVVLIKYRDYYMYVILLPIFTFLYNFASYIYVKQKYSNIKCEGNISKEQKKSIAKNVSALLLHKIGSVTVNTADNIVISAFLGLVVLSNYTNYYYIIAALTSIIFILFNSLTAGIGNKLITSSSEENVSGFFIIFYLSAIIISVCTVSLSAIFQNFITLWVGKEYLFDNLTMYLVCLYFYIHTIRRTIIMYRDASGMWRYNKWQPIVSALVNLTINIILIQIIGIKGILLSTIISMLVVDIPWETKQLINKLFTISVNDYYIKLIKYSCITVLSCLLVYFIDKYIIFDNLMVMIVIKSIIAVLISSSIFIVFTRNSCEYAALKLRITNFLNSRFKNNII